MLRWRNQAKAGCAVIDDGNVPFFGDQFIYSADKKVIAKLRGDKDSYYLAFDKFRNR